MVDRIFDFRFSIAGWIGESKRLRVEGLDILNFVLGSYENVRLCLGMSLNVLECPGLRSFSHLLGSFGTFWHFFWHIFGLALSWIVDQVGDGIEWLRAMGF